MSSCSSEKKSEIYWKLILMTTSCPSCFVVALGRQGGGAHAAGGREGGLTHVDHCDVLLLSTGAPFPLNKLVNRNIAGSC